MGRRGPAPKPTALRVIQGNPGKLKLNPSEPQPKIAPPDLPCPAYLTKEAREAWIRLRPDLPWLSVADTDLFAAYCCAYARWREAETFLEAHGLTFVVRESATAGKNNEPVPGAIKYIQQWPQVAIGKAALQMMCKIAAELGLSPAARTRIHVQDAEPRRDPDAERMFG